jgi:kynurenine formamidase
MRVRRVIDLSLAIDAGTQLYPGDPAVSLVPHSTIAEHGFNLLSVHLGSQSGTNVDAPYHFRADGARIDEVDLRLFTGTGVIIDVRGRAPRTPIGAGDVTPYLNAITPGTIVVLHTGWAVHYGTPAFFDHPYLGADACQPLLDRGVRTFCLDVPNVDETPDATHPGVGFPCHHLIADVGGIVVENLTALEQIDFDEPFISVLPLRLTGSDGAPTRAVAIEFGA